VLAAAPKLDLDVFGGQTEHGEFVRRAAPALEGRRSVERALCTVGEAFVVPGVCHVCARNADFLVDWAHAYEVDGVLTPNWRERLLCPHCGLNARMRATLHLVDAVVRPPPGAPIYLTEQVTPLFAAARRRFPEAVGSEWLGDRIPLGATDEAGVRNEDVTRLTFLDASFALVVTLDVLEHVPDYDAALAEFLRVLAPRGQLVLTCPFRADRGRNLVRAVVGSDGTIEHREPPEYHGDPLSQAGTLAYYHFGWELLDRLGEGGLADGRACQYWSRDNGDLGRDQLGFVARRP